MTTHNPGKQRLKVYEADLTLQQKLMAGHLSKELRAKHGTRGLPIRVGDTVKVMRGDYKGKTGAINQVDRARNNVYITGLMRKKADGKEAFLAFRPSNLLITAIDAKDKKRFKRATKGTKTETPKTEHKTKTASVGKKE